ncbi:MAG: CPBP family intramembrane metalloprotease [Clostridia bacterium]|nr:CPBP family intramembrane metalloprotease [Clostridia bacterium]
MSDMQENHKEAPAPVRRPTRLQALVLFAIAALAPFAESLYGKLLPAMDENTANLVLNALYYLVFLALPVFLCFRRGPAGPESLRPNPLPISSLLSIVAAALLCVFLVNDIVILWSIPFQKLGFNLDVFSMPVPNDAKGLTVCILYAAVLPGICEELLFRGAMLPAFEQEGTRRARFITALLFALLHGNIIGLPTQLLLGLILADIVVYSDSIYGGMIFHTAYNAALVIIQSIQQRAAADAAASADYLTAIGGMGGVFSLLVSILITGLMVRFSLGVLRFRARLDGREIRLPGQKARMNGTEIGVLVIGLALVALRYALVTYTMLTT